MVTVVTAARENDEYRALLDFKAQHDNMSNCIVSNFDVVEASSSQIRDNVKAGQSVSDLVPSTVEKYIKENNLYV
jgi:nicotinic acid mononucleotide adenylyltransferase